MYYRHTVIHNTLYPMLRTSHYHTALLVACLVLSGCSDKKASLPPPATANPAVQPPQAPAPAEKLPEDATLMRAVFGADYDANRKRATITQPVWNNPTERTSYAVTALAKTALPDGEVLLLATTRALDADGSLYDLQFSASLINPLNLYVLRKQDGNWKIIKRHEEFDAGGSFRDSGMVRWVQLGQGKTGLAVVQANMEEGFSSEILSLYDVSHGDIRKLTHDDITVHSDNDGAYEPREFCWNVTGKWKLAAAPTGTDYPDVLIEFTGKGMKKVDVATEDTDSNTACTTKPVKEKARYRFDGTSYKLIEGSAPV